ncbi:CYTH domain-containing protein [Sphaerochaeta sp.]|uniref:CYTH domain-containing protein n=1 Tax=Sphaerochaeta sp. TaxID=1972642 RepID=UPI002FCB0D0F
MGYEVELKAHVKDVISLKSLLDRTEGIEGPICELKDDIYYCLDQGEALFRLRKESFGPSFSNLKGKLVFTRKQKSLTDGIEVNRETEFTSDDNQFPSAHEFFLGLGYQIYIRKTKRGYSYTLAFDDVLPPLHIELVEVLGLGWFLEMEFILEQEEKVPLARTFLLDMLTRFGLDSQSIESRYYIHLLKSQTTG